MLWERAHCLLCLFSDGTGLSVLLQGLLGMCDNDINACMESIALPEWQL